MGYINKKNLRKAFSMSDRIGIGNVGSDYFVVNGFMGLEISQDKKDIINTLIHLNVINFIEDKEKLKQVVSLTKKYLNGIYNSENDIDAVFTANLKELEGNLAYIFTIDGENVAYDKRFVDCFKNVEFRSSYDERQYPILKCYYVKNLVGIIMPVMCSDFNYTTKTDTVNQLNKSIEI